jgi:hypothetical protein
LTSDKKFVIIFVHKFKIGDKNFITLRYFKEQIQFI